MDGLIKYLVSVDNKGAVESVKEIGTTAEKSGGKVSGKLVGAFDKLKGKINIISGLLSGALAKKFGDFIGSAVNGFAEFEQLAGGAEKIFGSTSKQIFADADNAYKTLNMSASDYMRTINDVGATFAQTMGAEAGYETAKRGLQAIADYASGTGKDVNTLSEKFTMITRSTGSYLSIADQFAGLLPQTTQGFLEQAQQAGFLSDKYTSLTQVPVAEYQAAIAAMLEKGTADMGLAGNTAAETATTITGSISAVKAEFQNWLVALADGNADIKTETGELSDAIFSAVENIVPRIGEVVANIPESLLGLISKLIGYVVEHAPEMLAAAVGFFLELGAGIIKAIPQIIVNLAESLGRLIKKVSDPEWRRQMLQAGVEMIKGLWSGIKQAIGDAIKKIPEAFGKLIDGVKNFFKIKSPSRRFRDEVGLMIPAGMEEGIEQGMPSLKRTARNMSAAALNAASVSNVSTLTINGFNVTNPQTVNAANGLASALRMDLRMEGV